MTALGRLPIDLPTGGHVALGDVADFANRAGTERNQTRIGLAPAGRDLQCSRPRFG